MRTLVLSTIRCCRSSGLRSVASFSGSSVSQNTFTSNILLIDVREPEEVLKDGKIPRAINIPLGQLIKAFYGRSNEEWLAKYSVPKPKEDDANIVFYGQAIWGMAIKSEAAVHITNRLGFMRVRHYIGGFKEWQDRAAEDEIDRVIGDEK